MPKQKSKLIVLVIFFTLAFWAFVAALVSPQTGLFKGTAGDETLPDLIISEVQAQDFNNFPNATELVFGTNYQFRAVIRNIHNASVSNNNLITQFIGPNATLQANNIGPISGNGTNYESEFSWTVDSDPAAKRWEICADFTAIATEAVETNNCYGWVNVTVKSPDLTIENVTFSPASGGRANTPITINFNVKNIGDYTATPAFRNYLYINGTKTTQYDTAGNVAANNGTRNQDIAWAPTSAGEYEIQICADNDNAIPEYNGDGDGMANNCSTITTYNVLPPTLTLNVPVNQLPKGQKGIPYNYSNISAGGGNGNYNFSIASGSLPAGLEINPSTGAISGTPTSYDSTGYTFAVQVTDTESPAQTITSSDIKLHIKAPELLAGNFIAPAIGYKNQPMTMSAMITNTGDENTDVYTPTTGFKIKISGASGFSPGDQYFNLKKTGATDSDSDGLTDDKRTVTWTWTPPAGAPQANTITICADPEEISGDAIIGSIPEQNEPDENNCTQKTINVYTAPTLAFGVPSPHQIPAGSGVNITLNSPELNASPSSQQSAQVKISSLKDTTGFTLMLLENGNDSSNFIKDVNFTFSSASNTTSRILQVNDCEIDTVTIQYPVSPAAGKTPFTATLIINSKTLCLKETLNDTAIAEGANQEIIKFTAKTIIGSNNITSLRIKKNGTASLSKFSSISLYEKTSSETRLVKQGTINGDYIDFDLSTVMPAVTISTTEKEYYLTATVSCENSATANFSIENISDVRTSLTEPAVLLKDFNLSDRAMTTCAPLPDLVPSDVSYTPPSRGPVNMTQNISINAKVHNIGYLATDRSTILRVHVNDAATTDTPLRRLIDERIINPDIKTKNYSFLWTPPYVITQTAYNLQICADSSDDGDPNGDLSELNENNNCSQEMPFDVDPPPPPNLTIIDFTVGIEKLNFTPAAPRINNAVTVKTKVKNNGNGPVIGNRKTVLHISDGVNPEITLEQNQSNQSNAANVATVTFPSWTPTVPGTYLFWTCADADSTITETNEAESDNCPYKIAPVEFVIRDKEKPNLVIDGILDFTPASPEKSTTPITITAKIKNTGELDVPAGTVTQTALWMQQAGAASPTFLAAQETAALGFDCGNASGTAPCEETETFTWTPMIPGSYSLWVCADAGSAADGSPSDTGAIAESDENNCSAAQTFVVQNSRPDQPTLNEPAHNATLTSLTPTLKWTAALDPDSWPSALQNFQWYIKDVIADAKVWDRTWGAADGGQNECGTDNNPTQANTWTCDNATVPAGKLGYGKTYEWTVQSGDTADASSWAEKFTFKTPTPRLTTDARLPGKLNSTTLEWGTDPIPILEISLKKDGGDNNVDKLKTMQIRVDGNFPKDKFSLEQFWWVVDSRLDQNLRIDGTGADKVKIKKNLTPDKKTLAYDLEFPRNALIEAGKTYVLYAKINISKTDAGKTMQPVITQVTTDPPEIEKKFKGGEFGFGPTYTVKEEIADDGTPVALTCAGGRVLQGAACACPAGRTEYAAAVTSYTPNVCIPCTVKELTDAGGQFCPKDKKDIPSPTIVFAANPATVTAGEPVTITWNTTNAVSRAVDKGVGVVASTGTKTLNPAATTTYTFTAINAEGDIVRKSVTVTVKALPATPPPPPAPAKPLTCEQQGKFTYTGQKKAERDPGMCISCPTQRFLTLGGKCDAAVIAVTPPAPGPTPPSTDQHGVAPGPDSGGLATGDSLGAQTGDLAGGTAAGNLTGGLDTSGTGTGGLGATGTGPGGPSLGGSYRLVRAPERARTGPGMGVYFGAWALAHGLWWVRKKFRK